MSPLDVATQVAVPEFDGRIITVPFSFKEIDDEGLISYVADPERCARVAGLAVRHARLRSIAAADRSGWRWCSRPIPPSTPASATPSDWTPRPARSRCCGRCATHGYRIDDIPGVDAEDGDALIHALIERGGQDPDWLTDAALEGNPIRVPAKDYRDWFATLPAELTDADGRALGPAARRAVRRPQPDPDGEIVIAAMQAGNVVLMVQPPRGFGEKPVAIYHDPDLPPSHHYLAAYHWIDAVFGADAVVHLGKHGNLEWLPGKTLGMSAACGTDAALGDLPLIYPFLVNDPGEGTQAKRRAHATLVDHLIPPMARAETYGDIARLEQLLDEHANIAALDPGKLPAIRQQIWTLMRAAKMDHDLGPGGPARRGFVRRHAAARRRLAVRDQGRPDPRRAAHPGRNTHGRSRTRPGAGDPAGPPVVRRRADRARACARRSASPRTATTTAPPSTPPRRGARELVAALQDSGWDAGDRRHPHRQRRRGGDPAVRRHRGGAEAGGHGRRDPRRFCARWTAGSSRRARRVRRCAGWSTCCPPAATSTPWTPRRCRRGWRGKPVWRWRIRCWRVTARTTATGRSRSVSRCGARRPCAPRATTSPKCLRCSASGRCGTTRRGGW